MFEFLGLDSSFNRQKATLIKKSKPSKKFVMLVLEATWPMMPMSWQPHCYSRILLTDSQRNIVECLAISNPHERNVQKANEHKLLCDHHILALILSVRNSNCFNEIPLLFGLLFLVWSWETVHKYPSVYWEVPSLWFLVSIWSTWSH